MTVVGGLPVGAGVGIVLVLALFCGAALAYWAERRGWLPKCWRGRRHAPFPLLPTANRSKRPARRDWDRGSFSSHKRKRSSLRSSSSSLQEEPDVEFVSDVEKISALSSRLRTISLIRLKSISSVPPAQTRRDKRADVTHPEILPQVIHITLPEHERTSDSPSTRPVSPETNSGPTPQESFDVELELIPPIAIPSPSYGSPRNPQPPPSSFKGRKRRARRSSNARQLRVATGARPISEGLRRTAEPEASIVPFPSLPEFDFGSLDVRRAPSETSEV